MGNTPPSSGPQPSLVDPLTYFGSDLPKYIVEERLGNGRFNKRYKCRSGDGVNLVVKLYVKRVGGGVGGVRGGCPLGGWGADVWWV